MSREHSGPDCRELAFPGGLALDEAAELALEDYARALARARDVEAIRDGGRVSGVHLCGLPAGITPAVAADVAAFARELALGAAGSGLGWA